MKDFYRALWSRIGGRPWTYIIRDIWHEYEWLMQLVWFWVGFLTAQISDWKLGLILWGVYTFGYINGHLFWGTRWKPQQPG